MQFNIETRPPQCYRWQSMTLYQLKVFATVANLESFTLAAQALKVRQPSVSLIIQGLQRELDIKLFERLGNKIHLTNAGKELLREAGHIVAAAERIKVRMDEIKGLRKGKISVGGSAVAATLFLPEAVQIFRREYPGIEIALRIEQSEVLVKLVAEGALDLAVLARHVNSPKLFTEPYHEEPIVAFVSSRHPLGKKRAVSLQLLANEPMFAHIRGVFVRDTLERILTQHGLTLKVAAEVEVGVSGAGREAIKKAVLSGQGVGFLSKCHVLPDVEAGRLKIIDIPEIKLKRTLYIVFHKQKRDSPLVQAFVKALKECKPA